jgi:hypothetical protein
MKTYTIQELCEDPPTDCWNTKYVLESDAMEFKGGTIHNSWQTAPREKLIEALQFQGAMTKELLKETEELHAEISIWKNRMKAIVGEDSPDIAGNRILQLQNELKQCREMYKRDCGG